MVTIDTERLCGGTPNPEKLGDYLAQARDEAGVGQEVTLTGQGPAWLHLALGHALRDRARKLIYVSPATGPVVIFDHTPLWL